MWLLKAVTSWLTKREKEGRQKSVNLDRKYQCLVSQIHLWISSVGFSCCWEDFYKRALPLQYINDLEVTKLTLSYALVIWKTNQNTVLAFPVYFFHWIILASTVHAVIFQIYSMFFFGILNNCMDVISLSTYYIFFYYPLRLSFSCPKKLWNSLSPLWNKSHKEEEKKAQCIPTEKKKLSAIELFSALKCVLHF